jgi:hypothetical protein
MAERPMAAADSIAVAESDCDGGSGKDKYPFDSKNHETGDLRPEGGGLILEWSVSQGLAPQP